MEDNSRRRIILKDSKMERVIITVESVVMDK